jgi:phage-related minor tail protein
MTPDPFALAADLADLEPRLADASRLTAAFAAELRAVEAPLAAATRDLGRLETGFAGGLRRAIADLVIDGATLSEALRGLGRALADTVYAAALRPVTDRLGSILAGGVNAAVAAALPFADGAPFSQGRVTPFAKGGVVAQATAFALRGGTGLMGEAGPEAIMPLARGPDGRLGVLAPGAGRAPAPQVTIHVATPDLAGFARSQSQIAAEMSRLLARGARNR